ncbi:sensor histidine kinase [Metabacillus endolithicus]|uniref:histidine kinase n=1 Tax=Metabacillus endolithicus TaxID=1535204 RepID=A0ABW5BQA0_9BACI
MKTIIRISSIFFIGIIVLFILIGILISVLIEYYVPIVGLENYSESIEIWLVICCFIIFCFVLGWIISRPVFIIQQWIKQLAKGEYVQPDNTLRNPLFFIFKCPFEDMTILTKKLVENKEERERIEKQKKEWMSGVSHDMKTPLTYIVGYSKMYLSKDHDWTIDEKRSFVKEIEGKSEYMKTLLDDLNLAFQMEQYEIDMNIETKDIVSFTRNVLADASKHPRIQECVLELEVEEESIIVPFDEQLLYRAFLNIITNALIHNPVGTKVTVHIYYHASEVFIEIEDNGNGMDAHVQQQLFNRYYKGTTTETRQEGTGLGMAIARQIVEAHGGKIQVYSKVGVGTVIKIILSVIT